MWLADIRVKWYAHSALNNLKLKQHKKILHRR